MTIIGVIHLTTHRLTFHASLLPNSEPSTESSSNLAFSRAHPGLDNQLVKAGYGVVHEPRSGFLHPQRRRRVWIELSHDMITTYPDSTDEGRIRPIRSLLCEFLGLLATNLTKTANRSSAVRERC